MSNTATKYRSFFMAVILLAAIPVLFAQQRQKKISLNLTGVTLREALAKIEKEADVHFSFNPRLIPLDEKVSIKTIDKTLSQVLTELLSPLEIGFKIVDNHVILKPDKLSPPKDNSLPEIKKYTISGYVRDQKSGEALVGANIYDLNTYKGTTTNGFGFFSLTLSEGQYRIRISLMGYSPVDQTISLTNNFKSDFNLPESGIDIQEVVIVSEKEIQGMESASPGEVRLTASGLKRMAGFAGTIDVLKSLQSVPGINAFGDGSSFYYVRGGNNDQNLILIDDAPIFNPAHLFGYFTAIAPDAVKDVKAYKGDFPASFGGRLSSVIDIRARDGNLKNVGFSGNLGIFTSDLTLEGPIIKEKSSFILSGRKSNLNWLNNNNINGRSFTIDFFDLNAKINFKINNKNRIFITAYAGKDDFSRITNASVNTFGISWDNSTATVRWNHLFNNRLFSNTTAIFSEYNYYLYISRQQDDYWKSSIRSRTLKNDLTWYPNPENTIKAGIELTNYHSDPGNVHFSDEETQRFAPVVQKYNSLAINLYVSNDQQLSEKLLLKYGLRFSSWRNFGPADVYFFDASHQVYDTLEVAGKRYFSPYYNLEPRFSLIWAAGKRLSFTAGYSRTTQYIQMLSNSTSPFTSLEVWAPSGPNIKPQKADQLTGGYILTLNKGINFSMEGFYKRFQNQIDYSDHANMLYNPLIEGELRFGAARSFGVEALLRRNEGRFTGWLGYTYARSFKTIDGINGNLEFPAYYDRPHSVFANLMLKAGKRWNFAANWCYMSGAAFTSPVSFMEYNGYVIPIYGKKHNDRFPDYHRLDLSVSIMLNKPASRYKHNLVFSLYNAYGHENPFSVGFNKIMNDNGDFVVPSNLDGSYEIIPTQLSVAGVIPSINYTFKFQ